MSINQQKDTSQNYIPIQELPADQPLGVLEPVMYFNEAMPTGVTVSQQGRIFVNFPKWGDNVQFTVAEIKNGKMVAYPDEVFNQTDPNDHGKALVSVQSVVVDPMDRLWILDTGSPLFESTKFGGPKMVCVNLARGSCCQENYISPRCGFPHNLSQRCTF